MAKVTSFIEPHRLYRYRSADNLDRELKAIQDHYIYCAPFEDLNDPMEGLFGSSERVRQRKNYRDVRAAILDNKARIGICSFSEIRDHELMWAHYAGQFRGICIAYSFSRLLKSLGDDVEFVRMYYDEKEPVLRHTSPEPMRLAKQILSSKNYRWLYEREWRMFAALGKAVYDDPSCVTHVYLGSRMEEKDRDQVRTKLDGMRLTVSDMSIEKYSINFSGI